MDWKAEEEAGGRIQGTIAQSRRLSSAARPRSSQQRHLQATLRTAAVLAARTLGQALISVTKDDFILHNGEQITRLLINQVDKRKGDWSNFLHPNTKVPLFHLISEVSFVFELLYVFFFPLRSKLR